MRSAFLLSALLAVFTAALPARAQTVQGRALDRETMQPLPGVEVALVDSAGRRVSWGTTGEDGAFRLEASRPGEYSLTAGKPGYRTMESAAVALAQGQTLDVEARITPGGHGLTGRVLEEGTDRPVPGATVSLRDLRGLSVGQAVTDDEGRFHLAVRHPGGYRLRADRVGYQRSTSPIVTLTPDDSVRVELRMSTQTVVLAPLTVVAQSREVMRDYQLAQFEWRREHQPSGRFLGPEEIRRINAFNTSDILQQVPQVRVLGGFQKQVLLPSRRASLNPNSGCVPNVYVDGLPFRLLSSGLSLDGLIPGTSVAAVEVYLTPGTAPGEFPAVENPMCGVIVVWTRPPGSDDNG